jgi:hypothetical protein
MLFALWAENRATEDADGNAEAARRSASVRSASVHTVSRRNSIIMPPPAVLVADLVQDEEKEDIKAIKLEADELQMAPNYEDNRPAVFKSTFWEVCCIASLVSAQLTNVFPIIIGLNRRNWLMHNKLLFLL